MRVTNRVRSALGGASLPAVAIVLAACSAITLSRPNAGPVTAAASGRLVPSTASATTIQRQPPAGACRSRGSGLFSLPDPRCTPGAVKPAVSQQNTGVTICREGFTAGERPPESVSEPEKRAGLAAYGDSGPLADYEYNHLIPLELGGAINDPRNLWPEPGASPNPKDTFEDRLSELVCRQRMTLSEAQRLIATDWVTAYEEYIAGGPLDDDAGSVYFATR